jgi:hypothetical protein
VWPRTTNKDGTANLAFGVDEDAVAKGLLMPADQHRLILRVFNRCLDGKLYSDDAVGNPFREGYELAERRFNHLLSAR